MSEESIWIVTDDAVTPSDTQRGYRDVPQERSIRVSVSDLESKMSHFIESVGRIFRHAEHQAAPPVGMKLDEIELSVEISGEGEVKLLGSGGKATGKGAIKLKFKRSEIKE
jgi:hypothetical protein